ncbi:hypothetical protein AB0C07_25190 [Actinoplanes missouriensis]|uniref:hypothetical protein n=1 Tax=Actinoplanes missouriensis TaxID=1866 RepID=UPI0033ED3A4E
MDALAEQLLRLVDVRLLDPLEILLEDDGIPGGLRAVLRHRAAAWSDTIEHSDDATAVRTLARLMATLYPEEHAFAPPADWWRTPLGQAVVRRVGHPYAETVSYATAGAMLGISRQGVHDLVRRGRLPRHPDGGVPVSAVRDRLLTGPPPSSDPSPTDPPPTDPRPTDPPPL